MSVWGSRVMAAVSAVRVSRVCCVYNVLTDSRQLVERAAHFAVAASRPY